MYSMENDLNCLIRDSKKRVAAKMKINDIVKVSVLTSYAQAEQHY